MSEVIGIVASKEASNATKESESKEGNNTHDEVCSMIVPRGDRCRKRKTAELMFIRHSAR
jgi:hypothetical protein